MTKYDLAFVGQISGAVTFYADRVYDAQTETYGNYIWYKREKCTLKINVQPAQGANYCGYSVNGVVYYSDPQGNATIDLSEIVKANTSGTLTLVITADDGGVEQGSLQIDFDIAEGIAYDSLVMPAPQNVEGYFPSSKAGVVAPIRIYSGNLNRSNGLAFEVVVPDATSVVMAAGDSGGSHTSFTAADGVIKDVKAASPSRYITELTTFVYNGVNYIAKISHDVVIPADCYETCLVRWLSEMGHYKQAIWLLKKRKKITDGSVALMTATSGYKTIKDERLEFNIFVEGLCAYDYSYYGDIVVSPEVYLVRYNESYAIGTEETRVEIVTEDLQLLDGASGTLKTLEVTVKYKHYDSGF